MVAPVRGTVQMCSLQCCFQVWNKLAQGQGMVTLACWRLSSDPNAEAHGLRKEFTERFPQLS